MVSLECPVCGMGLEDGRLLWSARRSDKRALKLAQQLENLERGRSKITELRKRTATMCAGCQLLMLGITEETDRPALRSRIKAVLDDFVKAHAG